MNGLAVERAIFGQPQRPVAWFGTHSPGLKHCWQAERKSA